MWLRRPRRRSVKATPRRLDASFHEASPGARTAMSAKTPDSNLADKAVRAPRDGCLFMASIHVRILEVFPFHEPEQRAAAIFCCIFNKRLSLRSMVPMRDAGIGDATPEQCPNCSRGATPPPRSATRRRRYKHVHQLHRSGSGHPLSTHHSSPTFSFLLRNLS